MTNGKDSSSVPADWTVTAQGTLPRPVQLWLGPIREQLDIVARSKDKPLAELTMPEVAAWAICGAWCVLTGVIAGQVAANVAVTVLRGPGRR